MERVYTTTLSQNPNPNPTPKWFSPETGIYSSMHAPRQLPHDPFLDVVSFIFSHDHRGRTALVDSASGRSLSYSDLRRTVAATAAGLHGMGITTHHTVLILLPNTILYPVVFLAILSVGAVVSTMNPLSSSDEIKKRIAQCRPALAVVAPENAAKLDGFPVRVVVVPENDDGSCPLFSADPASAPRPAVKQSDAAAVLFSSGTSGASKGVVLTHGNMIAMVELFVRFEASQYPRESWRDVYLAALPMFHVYGLSLFAAGLLSLGTTVVVMRKFDAGEAVKVIERYGVTHFPAVPPALAALCRAKTASGRALPSLLQASSGAAPLGKNILQLFLETFPTVDLIQGYGMTESTAVGARGFNTANLKKYSSAGLLAPNMQAKIVDCTTGLCLPPGSSGELWLRGPGIMKGYLDDERATSLAFDKDGWLRTGDIAYFDQDAYLYIVDRLKDTIKYKGFQIAPADLEAIIITHPEVLDVTVTALEDEEVGEIPVAFIVKVLGSELTSKDVIEFVAKQVAPYKKVRKVVFVNSIPRSPAGKILRRLLRNNLGVARL